MSDLRGFDQAIAFFETLPALTEAAIARGLEDGAEDLQEDATATALYNNDTGATRSSTLAYVDDGSWDAAIAAAFAQAETLNPGRSELSEAPGGGSESRRIVLTAFTEYLADLVTNGGGAQDWLSETMLPHSPRLFGHVNRSLGELYT